ncbi:(2Fe-2S)-binding protein [Clostridium botulinum]|nr:(2Fe-2S)-binding protein [Clostridium botulinum]
MIICGCFKVTIGDLKEAINNGAKTFEEIQKKTSVAKGCKKCTDNVKDLIDILTEAK